MKIINQDTKEGIIEVVPEILLKSVTMHPPKQHAVYRTILVIS